jgi:hypothetical protein
MHSRTINKSKLVGESKQVGHMPFFQCVYQGAMIAPPQKKFIRINIIGVNSVFNSSGITGTNSRGVPEFLRKRKIAYNYKK